MAISDHRDAMTRRMGGPNDRVLQEEMEKRMKQTLDCPVKNPVDPGTVSWAIGALEQEMTELGKEFGDLFSNLENILSPERPNDTCDEPPPETNCHAAFQIMQLAQWARRLTHQVRETISRVAL